MKERKEPLSGKSGKRRDKGDGSLFYVESERRWKMSFTLPDGKTKYLAGSVGGTKRAASDKLKKAMEDAKRGELVASSSQTVEQYMTRWLEEKKLALKDGTYPIWKNYIENRVIPDLGRWSLQRLKRDHVQAWINKLCIGNLAASTIRLICSIFKLAIKDAVKRQIIGVSPCRDITLPRSEDTEMHVLDPDQARLWLAWLKQTGHKQGPLYALAIHTGMRQGELLALRWSDVDLDKARAKVHVRRSVKYINGVGFVENEPKTKGSKRTIILTAAAVEVLRAHRKRQLEEIMEAGNWEEKNLVFPNRTGNFQTVNVVTVTFKQALKKAGLPKIRFHDLRHTAATLMLMSGIVIKSVQATLGHSTLQTTMKYLHLIPSMQEMEMEKLDAFLRVV